MKKTIVILILVIYVASIAIVNFFGLEIKQFDGVKYVDMITCDTITVQNEDRESIYADMTLSGVPLFIFDFVPANPDNPYTTEDESIVTNPNAITLDYEVFPHVADETGVRFLFDEEAMAGTVVFHETSRTFIFLKPNVICTITIESIDGSGVSTTIKVMGRYLEN